MKHETRLSKINVVSFILKSELNTFELKNKFKTSFIRSGS